MLSSGRLKAVVNDVGHKEGGGDGGGDCDGCDGCGWWWLVVVLS